MDGSRLNNSKVNVVYIINSLHTGGAEVGMSRLLAGLNKSEYEVTVVALDGHNLDFVDQIPSWVRVVDLRTRSGIGINTFKEFLLITRTADVIVGSLFHSSMVARGVKIINPRTVVATWHHANQFKNRFRRLMFYRTAFLTDVVLADSEPVAEMLTTDLGLNSDLVHTVPIAGIDLKDYNSAKQRNCQNIKVGIVGRLAKQKNYSMVLSVAEQLQDEHIQFEIAGDGELRGALDKQIDDRDLHNVTLHGYVDDIPSFLATIDIYFQPSHWEGLCITVLEAMASGLPVVGSNVGGIGRNVEEGASGFLCNPNDLDGFVSSIETLAQDTELRRRFGEYGKNTVKQGFTQETLVNEFERAIKKGEYL